MLWKVCAQLIFFSFDCTTTEQGHIAAKNNSSRNWTCVYVHYIDIMAVGMKFNPINFRWSQLEMTNLLTLHEIIKLKTIFFSGINSNPQYNKKELGNM
jgi:hypothetical protein